MASNYGVNAVVSVNASRPIIISSSTPIGVVGYQTGADLAAGLHYFGSIEAALEALEDATAGTLKAALTDMERVNVKCPFVLSVVTEGVDDEATTTALIAGVNALKTSLALFEVKPNLIIVPEHSHKPTVAAEMQSVADALLGTGVVDANAADEPAALAFAAGFGSKRILLCDPGVKTAGGTRPASPLVAAMIARTDGEREYGWADSFSNRVVNGVVGSSRVIEFVPGQECEADRLRTAGLTTLIRYSGWRFWGGETTDIDPIWQSLTRVRIFDRVVEAGLNGVFWAIGRRADELLFAKQSVEGMLNALKGANVLLGFNVFWDPERNTKENITAGKFYLVAEMQDTPIVKRFEINFTYVDKYGDVLIKMIS